MSTVLVAFASRDDTTCSITDSITDELRQTDHTVVVSPCASAPDLLAVDAAVVGSEVSGHDWLPEARDYLERQRPTLAGRPVYTFQWVAGLAHGAQPRAVDPIPVAVRRLCRRYGLAEPEAFDGRTEIVRRWAYLVGIDLLERLDLGWQVVPDGAPTSALAYR